MQTIIPQNDKTKDYIALIVLESDFLQFFMPTTHEGQYFIADIFVVHIQLCQYYFKVHSSEVWFMTCNPIDLLRSLTYFNLKIGKEVVYKP